MESVTNQSTVYQRTGNSGDPFHQNYLDFVELAVHDLHSPLRKLEVFIDQLVSKYTPVPDAIAGQYVERIHFSIGKMRSIIDDLRQLSLAIPESMEFTDCHLGDICQKLITEAPATFRDNQIRVTIGDLPVVNGDAKQLGLFFRKVFENAICFRRKDQALDLTVSAETLSFEDKGRFSLGPDNYFRITIADNGIGFGETDREKIFEPFVRLHGKSDYPGNGLGLAIVKRVAENHGGIVYAEGNREKGSRIIFIIPENHE
jgi:signal transduction histidine kinase